MNFASFPRNGLKKLSMSRKQERLVYWVLIATLSFTTIGMIKVEQNDFDRIRGEIDPIRTEDSQQGNVGVRKRVDDNSRASSIKSTEHPKREENDSNSARHKEVAVDQNCHLPKTDGYYDGDYYDGYGYGYYEKSGEDGSKEDKNEGGDKIFLGPCSYTYPNNVEPEEGFVHGIDFYHLRDTTKQLETCFLKCVEVIDPREAKSQWLIMSSSMGLAKLSQRIMTKFGYNPVLQTEGLNAVQVAIRGGHALTVKVLTNANNNMVIDKHGRTVADYVSMKGSPIRPTDVESILGLHHDAASVNDKKGQKHTAINDNKNATKDRNDSGWSTETSYSYDETCDIDVISHEMHRSVFFKEYYSTGRPFVLRGHVPKEEIAAFSKDRWDTKRDYNTHVRQWNVGPTAYPSRTNQNYCRRKYTITEIENRTKCSEMPDIPMVHAWHPTDSDFGMLYPMYTDEEFYKYSGWRKIEDWFGSAWEWEDKMSWQVFLGGDESGATLHWHLAALNMLYVGTKAWRLTAPAYRGWTGMPARKAAKILDESHDAITLRCTQHAGDLIYVPEHWGHLTLNHGFTIGAAVILPANYHKYNEVSQTLVDKFTPAADTIPAVGVQQSKRVPFMFVHINKTGGSSIIRMLQSRCSSEYVQEKWGVNHRTFHATALSHIEHFGRTTWDKAYTFAVVRHPLARQVSNFFFLANLCEKNAKNCDNRGIPDNVRGDKMKLLTDEEKIKAFHRWILYLYKAHPPGSDDQYLFGSLGHGNEEMRSFNNTQTSWLVDEKDDIVVGDIFRLEDLSTNMTKLFESIPCLNNQNKANHIDKDRISRMLKEEETHVDMIHSNAAPDYPDYKLFTKNVRTQSIMQQVYAVDYKNFGYDI